MQELIEERKQKLEQIEALKAEIEYLEDQIEEQIKDQIKERGSTTVKNNGYKITINYPVKTKWDEEKLKEVAEKIRNHGDDPEQYITFKPSVSEKNFNAWPKQIQDVFLPAKTTQIGKRQIKIQEDNNA